MNGNERGRKKEAIEHARQSVVCVVVVVVELCVTKLCVTKLCGKDGAYDRIFECK